MKIKCSYCNYSYDDSEEKCPNCGAINEEVVRTTKDQPQTIEELKQWYKARRLPPQETTRFFIGVDYKKPKAFGIYREEPSGKFIVYKNKASGERAIRYEGKDEAYAVNEIYMRLKQEIIEQKMNQAKKGNGKKGNTHSSSKGNTTPMGKLKNFISGLIKLCLFGIACFVGLIAILLVIGEIIIFFEPKIGYYSYDNTVYYRCDSEYNGKAWYVYTEDEWSEPQYDSDIPEVFAKKKTCKPYYISKKWSKSIDCTAFSKSVWANDLKQGINSQTGYYLYNDQIYYHLSTYFYDWYQYDKEWTLLDYKTVPQELVHSSLAKEYYQGKKYQQILDETDFKDTVYYADIQATDSVNYGYFRDSDYVYYHMGSNYDSGWYEYSDTEDWRAIESKDLPEDFRHASTVNDFYFTPEWDSSTQFTDFTDTSFYQDAHKSSNDSDSDYDWSSSDSWDSDSSDWDSDW